MSLLSLRTLFWLGLVVSAVSFLPGCATGPTPIGSKVEEDVILKDLCVRYGINCFVDSNSQVITIQKDNIQAKAMVGSDVVMVDSNKLTLSSPVRLSRGVVYVPADFKMKVISPIFKKTSSAGGYKILIDAGHGAHDPGGIGSLGTQEKDIVLDIAKRLKRNLDDRGFTAVMTRETDKFLELEERANLANQKGVCMLVSIHANIAKARNVKGLEVYSLRFLDAKETKEAIDPEKYRRVFSDYQMKKDDLPLKKTLIDMLRDYKDFHSSRLASCLSREVSSTLDTSHRGNKQAGFYVLKYTLVPSVLVEVGFLSNRAEEKNLQSGAYRQKIADGIAESLSRYIRTYVQ